MYIPSRLRNGVFGALVLALLTVTAHAWEVPRGQPGREGMSAERLERITRHMNARVDEGAMVGGLGIISRNGRIVYNETWGLADRETGRAMEEDALFRIYSMTKPIAGVAVMMLYEEGHFLLHDPVAKYIPELADLRLVVSAEAEDDSDNSESMDVVTREPKRQPNIRDLLRHTAGMTYGYFGDTAVDRLYMEEKLFQAGDNEEFVTVLGRQPLLYEPGTRWHYSVSVDVQGRLVEAISGMSLGEFLRQRIFEPLDMKDTSFVVPEDKVDRLAQLYSPEGSRVNRTEPRAGGTSSRLEVADAEITRAYLEGSYFESGGGGLVSTARDYMRFCLMMLNGGELNGVRLLSPRTVSLMTRSHTVDLPEALGHAGVGFGLGFAVMLDTGMVGEVGSDGEYNWGGAAGTRFWIDPRERLVGVFMVQSIPHETSLGSEFHALTYQAITESWAD